MCLNVLPVYEALQLPHVLVLKTNSSIHGLNKKQITEMLPLTTKESIILFDMTFYTKLMV